jgi:hexosaminidase
MNYRRVSAIASIVIVVSAWAWADTSTIGSSNAQLNLIPWPKSVQLGSGGVLLKAESRIVCGDIKLRTLAMVLKEELLDITGLDLQIVANAPRAGDVLLSVNRHLKAGEEILMVKSGAVVRTNEGAYRMTVKGGVRVEGYDYRAVAEGTATLLQAVTRQGNNFVVPCMTIDDWPHADYTGAMVDTARQDNPIEYLRQIVQSCRAYKVRYLQLHMTDDQAWTFPSKLFLKLGTLNGSAHGGPRCQVYALDDLKALVKYADERGVTLVPELETPGHSSNARATLPEYFGYIDPASGAAVDQSIMNVFNPKLYMALDMIIGEMCDVFKSSPYFHIGFDEVASLDVTTPQARTFMKEHDLADAGDAMRYFVVKVDEMVKKRGRKTIRWEGPVNEATNDIIVMTWCDHARTAEPLIAQGFTTITVPWNYAEVAWQDWTMYHANGSVLKKGDSVLGAMLPAWEQTGETHVRWIRGGIPGRQERTWGPDNIFTPEDFARRLAVTDRVLDRMIHGFAIRYDTAVGGDLFCVKVATPTTLRLESFPSLGKVRYTIDGTEPTVHSPVADKPINIADNFVLKACLFDLKGKAAKPPWRQQFAFEPLTFKREGILKVFRGDECVHRISGEGRQDSLHRRRF